MIKNCTFKDYPFCDGNCFGCRLVLDIIPSLFLVKDDVEIKVKHNNNFRDKVKELVQERKQNPIGRNNLEVSRTSLYHLLKRMDKESEITVDFFINGRWRFSSEGLELFSVNECLNFLPDDLIACDCELLSEEGKARVRVNI